MPKAKSAHYSKIIAEHSGDHRSVWKAFNKMWHSCPKRVLQNLSYVTADEVRRLVLRAPCKSSDLDPTPTCLVKDCIDILITPIAFMINLSLTEGSFPSHFKSAHVSPLLKKPSSIRIAWTITGQCPIWASFQGSWESSGEPNKITYKQFKHIQSVSICPTRNTQRHSSINGCREGHSTDIAWPFRCLWYHRPHCSLEKTWRWVWVTGKALDWFKSYLTGRCQRFRLGDCLSSKSDLKFGVPQGSILGPLLFVLYTSPLSSMISGHTIPHHLYADDSQLYISVPSENSVAALNGLQSCLASVQSWMSTNKLKLNPDNTEFLLIGTERQQSKYRFFISYWASRCQN